MSTRISSPRRPADNRRAGMGPGVMRDDNGFTLIETMIALGLVLIVAVGILPLGLIAVTTTENQGHLTTRTTEYAQDKLEQLVALQFSDAVTDTREFPAADTGGSGLAVGGSSDPEAPVNLYADYLDTDGTLVTGVGGAVPDDWFYKRVWAVTNPSGDLTLKQITVTVTVRAAAAGGIGRVPSTTLTLLKTTPF